MRWATDYDCIDSDGQRIIKPLWIDCTICRAAVLDVVHGVETERIIVIRPPVRICKEDGSQ